MNEPYFIEVDDNGYITCRAGQTWRIFGPGSIESSASYSEETTALLIAEMRNTAFIIDVSSAWDAAICRYRLDRSAKVPQMHSTADRKKHPHKAHRQTSHLIGGRAETASR